jgi:hypothetical protein
MPSLPIPVTKGDKGICCYAINTVSSHQPDGSCHASLQWRDDRQSMSYNDLLSYSISTFTLKMDTLFSSKTLVTTYQTAQCNNQMTTIWIFTAVRTSDLTYVMQVCLSCLYLPNIEQYSRPDTSCNCLCIWIRPLYSAAMH